MICVYGFGAQKHLKVSRRYSAYLDLLASFLSPVQRVHTIPISVLIFIMTMFNPLSFPSSIGSILYLYHVHYFFITLFIWFNTLSLPCSLLYHYPVQLVQYFIFTNPAQLPFTLFRSLTSFIFTNPALIPNFTLFGSLPPLSLPTPHYYQSLPFSAHFLPLSLPSPHYYQALPFSAHCHPLSLPTSFPRCT